MKISRRHALLGTLAGSITGCASALRPDTFSSLHPAVSVAFGHGVASGDPRQDSVVLWTRITTDEPTVRVTVEVATDPALSTIVRRTESATGTDRDHTVKIVINNLEPGETYYYRFRVGDQLSPIGRTRTLPAETTSVRFAVASCSNYPFGYFNAYDHIARQNVDAVIHLGDYLYEYGRDGYGGRAGEALGRAHIPPHEIVTLEDYRLRHAQYKADPSARAMHAAHAMISIWDDHETSNDSWVGGAENHEPVSEGGWDERRNAALQAYYEWMPVRDPEPGRTREALFRDFDWGSLTSLATLETRLMARSEPLDASVLGRELQTPEDIETFRRERLNDPTRIMLGDRQMQYLEEVMQRSVNSGTTWRLVANQVMMARAILPDLEPFTTEEDIIALEQDWAGVRGFLAYAKLGLPMNLDSWDGYPAERERLFALMRGVGARDLIVMTGDSHEAWANDLRDDAGDKMGVELGATGVTSPAPSSYFGDGMFNYSLLLRRENRDIRFHDPDKRGYFILELNEERGQVDFMEVSTIYSPDYEAAVTARVDLIKRNGTVEFSNPRVMGFKERVVFSGVFAGDSD